MIRDGLGGCGCTGGSTTPTTGHRPLAINTTSSTKRYGEIRARPRGLLKSASIIPTPVGNPALVLDARADYLSVFDAEVSGVAALNGRTLLSSPTLVVVRVALSRSRAARVVPNANHDSFCLPKWMPQPRRGPYIIQPVAMRPASTSAPRHCVSSARLQSSTALFLSLFLFSTTHSLANSFTSRCWHPH